MSMKLAVEVDGDAVDRVIDLFPPHGVRILHDAAAVARAKAEFKSSYRTPKNPFYFIAEWTGKWGTSGHLVEWLEGDEIPVTRYAEIFE